MMPLTQAIRQLLLDEGVAPVYMSPIPADQNRAVAVRGPYMNTADEDLPGLLRRRYQIFVRAETQTSADELSQRCYLALVDRYPEADVDTGELTPLQGPTMIGTDASGRYEYTFNVEIVCWLVKS